MVFPTLSHRASLVNGRRKAMRRVLAYAMVLVLCLWCSHVSPPSCLAVEDGRALAQMVYDRDDGQNSYAKVQMVLMSTQAHERMRTLVVAVKNYGKVSKRYIRFTEPASIAGTAFLETIAR